MRTGRLVSTRYLQVGERGLEPPRISPRVPKTRMYTNFITRPMPGLYHELNASQKFSVLGSTENYASTPGVEG